MDTATLHAILLLVILMAEIASDQTYEHRVHQALRHRMAGTILVIRVDRQQIQNIVIHPVQVTGLEIASAIVLAIVQNVDSTQEIVV
jgi:hypothetical protein